MKLDCVREIEKERKREREGGEREREAGNGGRIKGEIFLRYQQKFRKQLNNAEILNRRRE